MQDSIQATWLPVQDFRVTTSYMNFRKSLYDSTENGPVLGERGCDMERKNEVRYQQRDYLYQKDSFDLRQCHWR